MAGMQRLLTDLQYDIGPIDGFGGERTREAEAAYKLRYGVKGNPKGDALIGKLIETVQNEASERGLTLCNRTAHLVWAATGQLKTIVFKAAVGGACRPMSARKSLMKASAIAIISTMPRRLAIMAVWCAKRTRQNLGGARELCTKPTRLPLTVKKIAWHGAMTDMVLPVLIPAQRAVGQLI